MQATKSGPTSRPQAQRYLYLGAALLCILTLYAAAPPATSGAPAGSAARPAPPRLHSRGPAGGPNPSRPDLGSAAQALLSLPLAANRWAAALTGPRRQGPATTYTVINTNTSGAGSLAQAILDADGHSGLDTIAFNIAGAGVHTIALTSQLPFITDPVIIDGYTQPGTQPNTLAQGDNAVILIQLNGSAAGAANGLVIGAGGGGSTVRGLVINRFGSSAILVLASGDTITGNFAGTDPSGTTALGDGYGVICNGVSNNTIGGPAPAARNLLSGITGNAVGLWADASDNRVEGNYIGTNAAGTAALPNHNEAVWVDGPSNTIGGTAPGAGNLVSGNDYGGISLSAVASGNVLQGNYLGTDATGNAALPNYSGINLYGSASDNTIGGTAPGARNLISGNNRVSDADGIFIQNGSRNLVQGNYIGTNAAGTAALPNASDGIWVGGAHTTIGGTAAGAGNLISGNNQQADGIGVGANGTLIQGNRIGTDASGSAALPNGAGITIYGGSSTLIGGPQAGAGNTIAFNLLFGVGITSTNFTALSDTVSANAIYGNGALGIDLAPEGVNPNDHCDADTGPNNRQNYPVLTSATANGSGITIAGSLDSTPNSSFTLEFFANDACDPSGYGQGQTYLGSTMVTTNGVCSTNFTATFAVAVPPGKFITADATDALGDTSEFAHCTVVGGSGGATPSPMPSATAGATSTPTPTPGGPTRTPGGCAMTFSDVQPSDYFYGPVQYLACHGVISGYADGTFRPYNPTTRGQMVKIVVRGFNKPITTPPNGGHTFADVPTTFPFFPYIETAAALGIVSGYTCGGPGETCDPQHRPYFRPYANVTRGQIAKIAVNAAGWALANPAAGTFEDVAPGSPFYPFVETAVAHGIISGYTCGGPGEGCDGQHRPYFRPANDATRGQIAKIVYLAITAAPGAPSK